MLVLGKIFLFSFSCCLLTSLNQHAKAEDLISIFKIAEQNDPEFAAISASVMATREQRIQARAGLLPNISFDANTTYNNQEIDTETGIGQTGDFNFNSRGYNLKLKQPLLRYDRWLTLKQSDQQILRAEAEQEFAFQDLLLRVSERYFRVLESQDNLHFVLAEKIALERQAEETKLRYEAGFISDTDVQEANAAYRNSLAEELLAENELENSRELLLEIVGSYETDLSKVREDIPLINPNPESVDEWVQFALENNPELMLAESQMVITHEEVGIQKAGHLPTLDFIVTTGNEVQGGRFGDTDIDSTSAGLQLNIPLYSGGLVKSKTIQAQYLHLQAEHNYERQKRAVFRETRDAYLGIKSGISRIEALAISIDASLSALNATTAGFEAGTRTAVDVVSAERELYRVKRDYAKARYGYLLNILRLQKSVGLLVPADLKMINGWLETGET
ncbi:MAG: TolC family outer membrane protein [Gammaproteobacteria bacterium]